VSGRTRLTVRVHPKALVEIDRADALPAPVVWPAQQRGRDHGKRTPTS
jgi:hypothetical protein